MAFGFEDWTVVTLTEGVDSLGAAEESQMRRGWRLGWSTEARREMRRRVAKWARASSKVRTMLKPRRTRARRSARQKAVASGFSVEACGPFVTAARMVSMDQAGPTSAGNPLEA